MNRHYTLMLIPDGNKSVKTLKIPRFFFRFLSLFFALLLIVLVILGYDYYKIIQQVYENKHLVVENRDLKEQLQTFQMKMNALGEDLERIKTFEKKLKILSGVEQGMFPVSLHESPSFNWSSASQSFLEEKEPQFIKLEQMYEKKMASQFGLETSPDLSKNISPLFRQSFALSKEFARFDFRFLKLKDFAKQVESELNHLDQFFLDKKSLLGATPSILPAKGAITSFFGLRNSPYSGKIKMHEGLDIAAPSGTKIFAPANGVVVFAGNKSGFGRFLNLDHGYGMETLFAHSSKLYVKAGDMIERGQLIASIGSTGSSTGPHLHYEVRVNGVPVDPLFFILN
ncbi:MAG: M23 family metallopeptidase [Bacteriovoracaceae bacterium]|nr:M23 family metallopeptidase [Bacteriovoracaceae bacterium]